MRVWAGLVILSSLLLASVAQAQTSTPVPSATPSFNVVLAEDIFVRGGPGRAYIPVGALVAGDALQPVARNTDATWVMIAYNTGFGWIRRDLAYWIDDIDALPVVDLTNLTPSPIPGRETGTPFFTTPTPEGNWVQVGAQGAFVRAGPGRGYLRLDTFHNGDMIEDPVGQSTDGSWVMFRYQDGFAWIARPLVHWVDNVDALPVLSEDALTPSATFTPSPTSTLTFTPTDTPTATATATATRTFTPPPTSTATSTQTPTATASDTPTATPTPTATATATSTATRTHTSTATETPSPLPTHTGTLPPTEVSSATQMPSATPSPTSTSTATDTPPPTPTATATLSSTPTNTSTATHTATPTATVTSSPTATLTATPSATPTSTPTVTPTDTPSSTPAQTETALAAAAVASATREVTPIPATSTATETATPTQTPTRRPSATPTRTPTLTLTASATPTRTPTLTLTASATPTVTASPTAAPSLTNTARPSLTPTPRPTLTRTPLPTVTVTSTPPPSATPTNSPVAAVVVGTTPTATLSPQVVEPSGAGGRLPLEALVGGAALVVVIGYIGLYLRGLAASDRYANGFVIDTCPVCRRGKLHVESRQSRLVGIPRPRRIVRCDSCRSVLRETGNRRWRYAVDPMEHATLYERYNGREIDEETLVTLANQPLPTEPRPPRPPVEPPTFVDHDDQ